MRIEKDSLGEIKVPKNRYWGAQTQRSKENFKINTEKMPIEMIYQLAIVKRSCAIVNEKFQKLETKKKDFIVKVCDEIIEKKLDEHFPLSVWQTGSGTQTNMNVNEVIANRGNELAGEKLLHPNDDVNMSQSSNDTFPTAMNMAAYILVVEKLIPAATKLKETFEVLKNKYTDIIKIGRTHLQDATPLSLSQEISGWEGMIGHSLEMVAESTKKFLELTIGGTAVGTGINAPKDFGTLVTKEIKKFLQHDFINVDNKFYGLTSKDQFVFAHGAIKSMAANLIKIGNDIRFLASGPRSGIGEIIIPANEPGSSIMPGKVNPTQIEALTMVSSKIMGNDVTITFGASQGNFQLNVYMPVIIDSFLQSVKILSDAITSFDEKCCRGIEPNLEKIKYNLENSLMLVTALTPFIGYDKSGEIAKYAQKNNLSLKKAAKELGYLDEEEFDKIVKPENMITVK